jgi:hypothetical protein
VLVWSVRRHRSRASVTVALSLYALVAIVLSLPVLGDLY